MTNIIIIILAVINIFLLFKIKNGIDLIATDTRKKDELKVLLNRFSEIYLTDKKDTL